MELYLANAQWSQRPDDQKFGSLEDLHAAVQAHRQSAFERDIPFAGLRAEGDKGDLLLFGPKGNNAARMTHWAFGQLCQRIEAPASYLRELGPTLAAQNINYGLKHRLASASPNANVLFHSNGSLLIGALTTEKYSRFWNAEITPYLMNLQPLGWKPAGVDIRQKSEDNKENFDLYASDHDMFVFLCNEALTVNEKGSDGAMYKGLIVQNSEVGASSLRIWKFLYREKCGNHIIWGASDVEQVNIRHIGDVHKKWEFQADIRKYAAESVSELEGQIAQARTMKLGNDKKEVLDAIFKMRTPLSRKAIEAGYDACLPDEDGSPNTVWGVVQGLTRYSQSVPYADKRTEIDRAAGQILVNSF